MATRRVNKGPKGSKRQSETEQETETETELETEAENASAKQQPVALPPTGGNTPQPGEKFAPQTDVKTRTIWTLVMIAGFFLIIAMGHIYVVCLVLLLNGAVFREILELKRRKDKEAKQPLFRLITWWFFVTACYFTYGRWLGPRLQMLSLTYPIVGTLVNFHTFKAFAMYVVGFVVFVMSLRKNFYKWQFQQFAWSHMTLLLIVVQSSVMIINIFDGIMYFFLGTGLVIWNDVFAYIFGRWLGKRWFSEGLIALSPKKTKEGFLGAMVTTVMFGIVFSWLLCEMPSMTCPQEQITFKPFASVSDCVQAPHFVPQLYTLPGWLAAILGRPTLTFKPMLLHSLGFSMFASVIAPFGGFFASGFKRAFKIKDFGDSIPGHGGVTDRFDCQIIMSLFVYTYRASFLRSAGATVTSVLATVATMAPEAQQELLQKLTQALLEREAN